MDPVGPDGVFLVDYAVYDAIRAGFDKVVFVIRRDIDELFRTTIGSRVATRVKVDYVYQELTAIPPGFSVPAERKKPWGTGHATLTAASVVREEPFGVINADDFYGPSSYRILADFLNRTAGLPDEYCMVGFTLCNTLSEHGSVARGICSVGPDGWLRSVVERTKIEKVNGAARYLDENGHWVPLTGSETVSMNMWGFKPLFFAQLESEFRLFLREHGHDPKAEFFVPTVVNNMISAGRARTAVLPTSEKWFGVTYPQEKALVMARLRELIQAGVYPEHLWS